MDSKFERGDVIKEKGFDKTMKYIVLDTVRPEFTSLFTASGLSATIRKEWEQSFEKIGHIDLSTLMRLIEGGGIA